MGKNKSGGSRNKRGTGGKAGGAATTSAVRVQEVFAEDSSSSAQTSPSASPIPAQDLGAAAVMDDTETTPGKADLSTPDKLLQAAAAKPLPSSPALAPTRRPKSPPAEGVLYPALNSDKVSNRYHRVVDSDNRAPSFVGGEEAPKQTAAQEADRTIKLPPKKRASLPVQAFDYVTMKLASKAHRHIDPSVFGGDSPIISHPSAGAAAVAAASAAAPRTQANGGHVRLPRGPMASRRPQTRQQALTSALTPPGLNLLRALLPRARRFPASRLLTFAAVLLAMSPVLVPVYLAVLFVVVYPVRFARLVRGGAGTGGQ
ncbi:hypothetical protein RI367_006421 [Sorochytrium milnesiophthora]